jgi:hypothetical protein
VAGALKQKKSLLERKYAEDAKKIKSQTRLLMILLRVFAPLR